MEGAPKSVRRDLSGKFSKAFFPPRCLSLTGNAPRGAERRGGGSGAEAPRPGGFFPTTFRWRSTIYRTFTPEVVVTPPLSAPPIPPGSGARFHEGSGGGTRGGSDPFPRRAPASGLKVCIMNNSIRPVTEQDVFASGERLGISPKQLRKLLSYRIDSFDSLQRGFIRAGLEPTHPVRLALSNDPLVMYEVYQQFLNSRRRQLSAIRQGHGQRLGIAKARGEARPFDPSKVPLARTGQYSVIQPEDFDRDELFEGVQPGRVRIVSGRIFPEENFRYLSEQTEAGFTCERCHAPVHMLVEPEDYRRVALCRCVAAIAAPPYSADGFSSREWALIVHNFLVQGQESLSDQ